MVTSQEFQSSLDYLQAQEKLSFLPHPQSRSVLSDATEIIDTDYDSDSLEGYSDDSRHRSVDSLGADSVTTVSTPDELKTPDSTGLTAFHFLIEDNSVKGPVGPHLFRNSEDSLDVRQQLAVDLYHTDSKIEPERRNTPVPDNIVIPPQNTVRPVINRTFTNEDSVTSWTPNHVVQWMHTQGFEDSIIEKFFINDISGPILLELQADDLKELDIPSFGKRHQLMTCIRQLRRNSSSSRDSQPPQDLPLRKDTTTPQTTAADVGVDCTSPGLDEENLSSRSGSGTGHHRHHPHHNQRQKRGRHGTDLAPEDSVSIVAIEQLLPKLHTCSKGENCRKWQKQQVKLARIAKDLPLGGLGGSILVTGDPGNPATAQALARTPRSDVTPSILASSDVMGPGQVSHFNLSEEKLNGVIPRDPQENVRNFLNFQRLSTLQPVSDPTTPPMEQLPSPESPGSAKGNPTLSENLRHLPKLRIPSLLASDDATFSPTSQRTATPSALQKKQQLHYQSMAKSPNLYNSVLSPSDYYREDPHYGQSTPFSEVDAPLTAIPLGPVARNISQSVPPDMRFGGRNACQVPDPIYRPTSTKAENHRRLHSAISGQNLQTLVPVDEREPLRPIETPEDMQNTPRAPHCRNNPFGPEGIHANDIIHSGWMKKRKTTKLIRHEWDDHHFTLRGTQLSMYSDEEAAQRNSKALEHIDVDDYAVACSSLASNSKLTAAFKKTVLKRNGDSRGEAAFAFSLIPASNENKGLDRKSFLISGPKPHHFAVKTRDERIDWMRELMLAKALRRGRESGDSLNLNGAPF